MDEILKQFLQAFPSLTVVVVILAFAWFLSGENRKTRQALEEEVKKSVNARIGEMLGDIQSKAGKINAAVNKQQVIVSDIDQKVKDFADTISSYEHNISELYNEASEKLGQLSASIPNVAEDSAEEILHLVRSAKDGRTAAALALKLLDHDDASSLHLESAGDRMRNIGRSSLALSLYAASNKKDPGRKSSEIELRCLQAETDFNNRLDYLRRASELALQHPDGLSRVYNTFIRIEDNEGLLGFATEAEQVWSHDYDIRAEAFRNKAVALRRLRRIDEASAAFAAALEIKPDDEDILRPYSVLLGQQNNRPELEKVLLTLQKIDPLDAGYYIDLAEYYINENDIYSASVWIKKSSQLPKEPHDEYRLDRIAKRIDLYNSTSGSSSDTASPD